MDAARFGLPSALALPLPKRFYKVQPQHSHRDPPIHPGTSTAWMQWRMRLRCSLIRLHRESHSLPMWHNPLCWGGRLILHLQTSNTPTPQTESGYCKFLSPVPEARNTPAFPHHTSLQPIHNLNFREINNSERLPWHNTSTTLQSSLGTNCAVLILDTRNSKM